MVRVGGEEGMSADERGARRRMGRKGKVKRIFEVIVADCV
jgi:hypothetical protein